MTIRTKIIIGTSIFAAVFGSGSVIWIVCCEKYNPNHAAFIVVVLAINVLISEGAKRIFK